jgi:hypothetical protein
MQRPLTDEGITEGAGDAGLIQKTGPLRRDAEAVSYGTLCVMDRHTDRSAMICFAGNAAKKFRRPPLKSIRLLASLSGYGARLEPPILAHSLSVCRGARPALAADHGDREGNGFRIGHVVVRKSYPLRNRLDCSKLLSYETSVA